MHCNSVEETALTNDEGCHPRSFLEALLWPSTMSTTKNDDGAEPPTAAEQMRVSNAPRRKVALPPGRSQLDWMRNSKRLPSRKVRPISMAEVKKHSTRTDAWTALNNTVYDITPYLEYHPGGIPILMSAAGRVLFHYLFPRAVCVLADASNLVLNACFAHAGFDGVV